MSSTVSTIDTLRICRDYEHTFSYTFASWAPADVTVIVTPPTGTKFLPASEYKFKDDEAPGLQSKELLSDGTLRFVFRGQRMPSATVTCVVTLLGAVLIDKYGPHSTSEASEYTTKIVLPNDYDASIRIHSIRIKLNNAYGHFNITTEASTPEFKSFQEIYNYLKNKLGDNGFWIPVAGFTPVNANTSSILMLYIDFSGYYQTLKMHVADINNLPGGAFNDYDLLNGAFVTFISDNSYVLNKPKKD